MKKGNVSAHAKKKAAKPFVIVLICLALAISGMAAYIYNEEIAEIATFIKNNISTVFYALSNSAEDVSAKSEENDRKQQELLEQVAEVTMRDLTDEERQLLAEGKLSYEEALALIKGEMVAPSTTADPVEETAKIDEVEVIVTKEPEITEVIVVTEKTEPTVTEATVPTTTPEVETTPISAEERETLKKRIDDIIAEIYLLRATYLNKIDELIEASKKEYMALPKSEHTLNGKMRLVEKVVIPKGNALEAECDKRMKLLLDEFSGILKKLGEDNAIIGEIEKTDAEQKKIKKTELINKYMVKAK